MCYSKKLLRFGKIEFGTAKIYIPYGTLKLQKLTTLELNLEDTFIKPRRHFYFS